MKLVCNWPSVLNILLGFVFIAGITACSPPPPPTPTSTPKPVDYSFLAEIATKDEAGVTIAEAAHVWEDARRTNLAIACTIRRGETVEIAYPSINSSVRVKLDGCEGWIGEVQLVNIRPK